MNEEELNEEQEVEEEPEQEVIEEEPQEEVVEEREGIEGLGQEMADFVFG